MNRPTQSENRPDKETWHRGARPGTLFLAVVGALVLIAVLITFNFGPPPAVQPNSSSAANTAAQPPAAAEKFPHISAHIPTIGVVVPSAEARQSTAIAPKKAVADLVEFAAAHGQITHEQAEKFKSELVKQGPAAVPAIQDFLEKNMDSMYGEELGYSSLRLTMLDTLKQIGGPEAQGAMVHVLQTTAEPNEVLEVAKDLELNAPGQYRDQILQAARETLDMAFQNRLGSNVDCRPFYRVFESYGAVYTPPSAVEETRR